MISDENLGVPKSHCNGSIVFQHDKFLHHESFETGHSFKNIIFGSQFIKLQIARKYETFYRCHCHDCCRFCTRLQWKMWPRIEQMQIRLWLQRFLLGEMQPKLLQMPWPMLISVQVIEFCTEIKNTFHTHFKSLCLSNSCRQSLGIKLQKDEATVKILCWKVSFLWNLFLPLVHELAKHFCFWCRS